MATGRVGRYPAIAWTTRDLVHWKRATIAPQAGAQLIDTPQGLFATGSLRHSARLRDQKTRPAIWRLTGTRRRRVVTLPTADLSYFGPLASDGQALIAIGNEMEARRPTAPYVYSSADGRHWRRVAMRLDVFPEKNAPPRHLLPTHRAERDRRHRGPARDRRNGREQRRSARDFDPVLLARERVAGRGYATVRVASSTRVIDGSMRTPGPIVDDAAMPFM